MASPTTAITRLDLSRSFDEFDIRMNQRGYIGARVLRPFVVGSVSANVGRLPLEALLQSTGNGTALRAPGSGYKRDTFEFETWSYKIDEFGKEDVLDDAQLAMYRDIFDAEQVAADRATDFVLNEYERDVAAAVFNTTTWTGASLTTAVSTPWATHATATPIGDVAGAKEKVRLGSGLEPNAIILSGSEYENLVQTAQIVDRIKYTTTPTDSQVRSAIAEMFGVRYVLVPGGMKNTASPGAAATLTRIWPDNYVMVCRIAETDDPREPSIGRTFIWPGDGPGLPGDDGTLAVLVEEYREEAVRGSVVRARNNRDIQIMYATAGHLLTSV